MKDIYKKVKRRKDKDEEITSIEYNSSWEHFADELKLLDLFLILKIKKEIIIEEGGLLKKNNIGIKETYAGLEMEWIEEYDENLLKKELIDLEKHIEKRLEASKSKGIKLALPCISKILNLSFFEERCIIGCLALEIDKEFWRKYAYFQDNLLEHSFTVDLALRLFAVSDNEKILFRAAFTPQAPLMKFLMETSNFFIDRGIPLISRSLKLSDWAVNYLLDFEILDKDLIEVAEMFPAQISGDDGDLLEIEKCIVQFMNHFKAKEKEKSRQIFYLYGTEGSGKKSHVKNVCKKQGYSLIIADIKKMLVCEKSFNDMLMLLARHAMIGNAAICFENFDVLLDEDEKYSSKCEDIINMLKEYASISFIIGKYIWSPVIYDLNLRYVQIKCEVPSERQREEYWQQFSNKYNLDCKVDLRKFTESFRFTPGQIRSALNYGESLAVWNGNINGLIGKDELFSACYSQSNRKLNTLAKKIKPIYSWDVIVLPYEQKTQLKEICDQMKYRTVVYRDWGFDKRLSLGKGINVLFSGPPGCGKTMAAEVIANDLGLEIYKIDLSRIVSKYIGETEKNLAKIFFEAESSNAILFFDEADSMFGKRSEVKDAHDKYANLETSYLLQKIEEYKGIVILATNLNENMDEAFLRRLNFSVQFPFPEKEQRKLIWQGMFPKGAPLHSNIDYEFMADKFRVSGGSIKNIALNAAFYAAQEGKCIGMEHIMLAAKREYVKLGKTFLKSDFDPYYRMIEVI